MREGGAGVCVGDKGAPATTDLDRKEASALLRANNSQHTGVMEEKGKLDISNTTGFPLLFPRAPSHVFGLPVSSKPTGSTMCAKTTMCADLVPRTGPRFVSFGV